MNDKSSMTRRGFLGTAASAAVFTIVPRHVLGGPGRTAPSDKLNIAAIGVAGMGRVTVMNVKTENIVALCDVDQNRAGAAFAKFPRAKKYSDFRKMFDQLQHQIDAVVVSTPDHTHAPATAMEQKDHGHSRHVMARRENAKPAPETVNFDAAPMPADGPTAGLSSRLSRQILRIDWCSEQGDEHNQWRECQGF